MHCPRAVPSHAQPCRAPAMPCGPGLIHCKLHACLPACRLTSWCPGCTPLITTCRARSRTAPCTGCEPAAAGGLLRVGCRKGRGLLECCCTTVFSGLCGCTLPAVPVQVGVGRRVGEQPEHLWSFGKALFQRARYVTFAHWVDVMNMWLDLMTTLRQEALPHRLHKKLQAIEATICECP